MPSRLGRGQRPQGDLTRIVTAPCHPAPTALTALIRPLHPRPPPAAGGFIDQGLIIEHPREFDWRSITAVEGSQARAFEELCYQLRDPSPVGWGRAAKPGSPDGGLEWYYLSPDGSEAIGFQCKYVFDVGDLIGQALPTLQTVAGNRAARPVTDLTFIIPFDLPAGAERDRAGRPRTSARIRWEQAVTAWADRDDTGDIRVHLIEQAVLFERLLEPGNEGRRLFFFGDRALTPTWFEDRFAVSAALADDRYTPDRNVPLPLNSDIGGAVLDDAFIEAVATTSGELHHAVAATLAASTPPPEGLASDLCRTLPVLVDTLRTAASAVVSASPIPEQAEHDTDALMTALIAVRRLLPEGFTAGHGTAEAASDAGKWSERLRSALNQLYAAAVRFSQLAGSTANLAARSQRLLIIGAAGQGKTHLALAATRAALDRGQPALCILGEQLIADRDILGQIAEHCGLGPLPHDTFLGMLQTAAQIANRRVLLVIDALNESDRAGGWRRELLVLWQAQQRYPELVVIATCRDVFADDNLPARDQRHRLEVVEVFHPGFVGRETEALETYFATIPDAWAWAPRIQPDFTNPLFLKLYASSFSGVADIDLATHRSAVFRRFLTRRLRQASDQLELDPAGGQLETAVRALTDGLAETRSARLPRPAAEDILNRHVPDRTRWPKTPLAVLHSLGVLDERPDYQHDGARTVGFPYQAFGDFTIATAVLDRYADAVTALAADPGYLLPDQDPLRDWLAHAPPNLLEALVVLLPERTGRELIDCLTPDPAAAVAASRGQRPNLRQLLESTVNTIPRRRTDAVTERTIELGNLLVNTTRRDLFLPVVLAVTAEPGHLLNADRLHQYLLRLSRPARDARWIPATWSTADDEQAPLFRLLRWAERLPTPADLTPDREERPGRPDPETVRLAATALTWLLTSSNRFVRDRTTKALVQLLLGHPDVLTGLLRQFLVEDVQRIDDPYLSQRLAAVAYGWTLRVGGQDPTAAVALGRFALEHLLDPDSILNRIQPDLLTRDSAQGLVHAAARHDPALLADPRAHSPWRSSLRRDAPPQDALRQRYPIDHDQPDRNWADLHLSLFMLGDFGNYEVDHLVHTATRVPRTAPGRYADVTGCTHQDEEALRAFLASLDDTQRARALDLGAALPLLPYQLLTDADAAPLNDDQRHLLDQVFVITRRAPRVTSGSWARRWIFRRVASLGWTPRRFADFDRSWRMNHGASRTSHKVERIGKKYQWIALHELTARLIDNYHVRVDTGYDRREYLGAWQLGARDIDPSLPPAHHPIPTIDDYDPAPHDEHDHATFDGPADRFHPPGHTPAPAPAAREQWVLDGDDLPRLDDHLIWQDTDQQRWIALSVFSDSRTDEPDFDDRADEWAYVFAWLVSAAHGPLLADFLSRQTLMGRWMPEGGSRTGAYLGEADWAASWEDHDDPPGPPPLHLEAAQPVPKWRPRHPHEPNEILVAPATHGYLWEAATSDCSVEQSIDLELPARSLLAGTSATRHPDRPDWYDGDQQIATWIRYRAGTTTGTALLVRETWLQQRLRDTGLHLVAGLLGERRSSGNGPQWREIDQTAHITDTEITITPLRSQLRQRPDHR